MHVDSYISISFPAAGSDVLGSGDISESTPLNYCSFQSPGKSANHRECGGKRTQKEIRFNRVAQLALLIVKVLVPSNYCRRYICIHHTG